MNITITEIALLIVILYAGICLIIVERKAEQLERKLKTAREELDHFYQLQKEKSNQ